MLKTWCPWWVCVLKNVTELYTDITVDRPPPAILDVMATKHEFEADINLLVGAHLRTACMNHLMPLVHCPWGDLEYYHCCRHIAFDLVVRAIFGNSVATVKTFTRSQLA